MSFTAAAIMIMAVSTFLQISGSTLAGRVSDATHAPVPGATVHISGAGRSASTVSDVAGRFRFDGLAGGSYVVTVSLAGFRTQSFTVRVDSSAREELQVTMRTGVLAEILWVAPEPADAYRRADAIAHLRIDSTRLYGACGDDIAVTSEHAASVLRVFKGRLPPTIQLHQESAGRCRELTNWIEGFEAPYRVGEEYVVFLTERADGFGRLAGPALAFRVSGGLVHMEGFDGVKGTIALDDLARRLERLSR
jgi:hypothetical protein